MKKINHWINGKNVAGADYFHTTNPATGEVLAERNCASECSSSCRPQFPPRR